MEGVPSLCPTWTHTNRGTIRNLFGMAPALDSVAVPDTQVVTHIPRKNTIPILNAALPSSIPMSSTECQAAKKFRTSWFRCGTSSPSPRHLEMRTTPPPPTHPVRVK